MNNYSVESLEGFIEKCKDNIKIFEEAIQKERDSISEAYNMIEVIRKKELLEEGAASVDFEKMPKKDLKEDVDATKDIFSSNQIEIIEKFVASTEAFDLDKDKLVAIGKQLWEDSQIN